MDMLGNIAVFGSPYVKWGQAIFLKEYRSVTVNDLAFWVWKMRQATK